MATIIISLVFCLSLFLSSVPAYAAVFNVSSGDVTGLIAAINAANATPEEDTINLEAGTYTLINSSLGLRNVTINGQGAESTIIERDPAAVRLFGILHASGNVTINGLTIRRGLSLHLSILPGDEVRSAGIGNSGTLTVNRSIITDNRQAGGIRNSGTLYLIDSIVTRNGAFEVNGTGVYNEGTAHIIRTKITQNGGDSAGTLFNAASGTATVQNSTISDNTTWFFGGIYNAGMMTITNSTIANNHFRGGGVAVGSLCSPSLPSACVPNQTTIVRNSTIAGNDGVDGGVSSEVQLQNTIVALNALNLSGSPTAADCIRSITSLGNNIIGDPTWLRAFGDRPKCEGLLPSDLTGDPGLGAFIDSGAPGTGRFPLLETSQAIDAGNNEVCSSDPALATDQLGTPRNGPCDIGAVEFYPVVNDLVALANLNTAFDATPVPGGPAGTFHITADFANTSNQPIVHPFVEVVEFSGGNLLLNADGGAGGVGARVTTPDSATTPFQPGASSTFEFLIGLQQREPFTFFVNMLGGPQTSVSMR